MTPDQSADHPVATGTADYRKIFKNVGVLYLRIIVSMLVTLYTTRVILSAIGVEDFGIYLTVLSLVTLIGLSVGGMTTAAARFFALDLGQTGGQRQSEILNASLQLFMAIGALIALLCLTLGYWLTTHVLTIPPARAAAAEGIFIWVLLTFLFGFWVLPFRGLLLAHERMDVFAAVGLVEVFLRLFAALALQFVSGDKLVGHSILVCLLAIFGCVITALAARRCIPAARLKWRLYRAEVREILTFVRWDIFSRFSPALRTEGSALLLNLYFGPAVNGAMGLAEQANRAVKQFIFNMQMAFNPQIVRLYGQSLPAGAGELARAASRYNFLMFFLLAFPLYVNAELLLGWWLVDVPPNTALFLRFAVIASVCECMALPIMTLGLATDRVKLLQTVAGGTLLLNVPISALLLDQGAGPVVVLQVAAALSVVGLMGRVLVIRYTMAFSVRRYLIDVIVPSLWVLVLGYLAVHLLSSLWSTLPALIELFVQGCLILLVVVVAGLSGQERRHFRASIEARFRPAAKGKN